MDPRSPRLVSLSLSLSRKLEVASLACRGVKKRAYFPQGEVPPGERGAPVAEVTPHRKKAPKEDSPKEEAPKKDPPLLTHGRVLMALLVLLMAACYHMWRGGAMTLRERWQSVNQTMQVIWPCVLQAKNFLELF